MTRTMLAAGLMATLGALPVFLLGAQSVLVREDLNFTEPGLGLAVGVFFGAAALAAIAAGSLVDTMSRRRGMVTAGALSALSCVVVSLGAHSYLVLLLAMVLAGVANAALQLTANLSLARSVPRNRQGLAFGVKQSAVPASILLGGLAVPTIGLLVGWRWTYVAAAFGACVVVIGGLRSPHRTGKSRSTTASGKSPPAVPLMITGVATAMGNASASSLGAFLPAWAFHIGVEPGMAGLLLAAGAMLCIVGRVVSGVFGDRRTGRNFPVVAVQFVVGAVGFVLLSFDAAQTLVAGALLAFGFGWSWPGLLMFAVVRIGRDRPASASSAVQAGGFAGGAVGPVLFGILVAVSSYSAAWLVAAAVMLVAAALLLFARRMFIADLLRRPLPG